MKQDKIIISGGLGLLTSLLITAITFLIRYRWWPIALFNNPLIAWLMFLMFGGISLIEIPVMIYGLRKILNSNKPSTVNIALLTNGVFVSFTVIYALPNLLLTNINLIWMGLVLTAFSFIRFGTSIIFLPTQSP